MSTVVPSDGKGETTLAMIDEFGLQERTRIASRDREEENTVVLLCTTGRSFPNWIREQFSTQKVVAQQMDRQMITSRIQQKT